MPDVEFSKDISQATARLQAATVLVAFATAWVALHDLFTHMNEKRLLRDWPLASQRVVSKSSR